MDIEKAIEIQKSFMTEYKYNDREKSEEVRDFTIIALEELQQYRQIGTLEECRAAVDRIAGIPKTWNG